MALRAVVSRACAPPTRGEARQKQPPKQHILSRGDTGGKLKAKQSKAMLQANRLVAVAAAADGSSPLLSCTLHFTAGPNLPERTTDGVGVSKRGRIIIQSYLGLCYGAMSQARLIANCCSPTLFSIHAQAVD